MFVPNFKILGALAPEKSLTEKQLTHIHTHTVTEKTKTLYAGGINRDLSGVQPNHPTMHIIPYHPLHVTLARAN